MFDFENININDFQTATNTLRSIKISVAEAINVKQKKCYRSMKPKLQALVNVLNCKIMSKRMDFWLPFKVNYCRKNSGVQSAKKKILEIDIDEKIMSSQKARNELFDQFGLQKVVEDQTSSDEE